MASIPGAIVEYILSGKSRPETIQRFTSDSGIITDVWQAFATDPDGWQRILVAPAIDVSAIDVGFEVHHAITHDRGKPSDRFPSGVSPLESVVAMSIYFDELVRIVLPRTTWWSQEKFETLLRNATQPDGESMLERAILFYLGHEDGSKAAANVSVLTDQQLRAIAPVAALIGVFFAAKNDPEFLKSFTAESDRAATVEIEDWVKSNAKTIADEASKELCRPYYSAPREYGNELRARNRDRTPDSVSPGGMIKRVFLDRLTKASGDADRKTMVPGAIEALRTVNADAAVRVFDISCRNVTWAIVDAGIAATHPAFLNHDAQDRSNTRSELPRSRIKATYDFTRVGLIVNLDLTLDPYSSPERTAAIDTVVDELDKKSGGTATKEWRRKARKTVRLIALQLDSGVPPDWGLVETLISVDGRDGPQLVSDHGTFVAGILGADWRQPGSDLSEEHSQELGFPSSSLSSAKPRMRAEGSSTVSPSEAVVLQGVCPDIGLMDFRISTDDDRSSERSVVAALDFVQYLNRRSGANGPVVHGVNISLQIRGESHIGCGRTPVCVSCDRLVSSGVVVVAAAGNFGWSESGRSSTASIADPGNARDAITVGSTHRDSPNLHGVSYFSSRGPTVDGRAKPDLVAPGEKICGPIRGDVDEERGGTSYEYWDGTSMAAPFVSGAAAILLARHRELIGNPSRVKDILCQSATDLVRDRYAQGHGLVNILRALESV